MVLTIEAFIRTLLGQLSHPNSLGTARNSERAWVMIREADSPQDTLSGNVFEWLGNASQLTSENMSKVEGPAPFPCPSFSLSSPRTRSLTLLGLRCLTPR